MADNFNFFKAIYRLEFKSALEYRWNFIFQSFGMLLQDAFWLIFWGLLIYKFQSINGWNFKSILYLNSIIALSYGITATFFGNSRRLALLIEQGQLDYYLTLPKKPLFHIIAKFRYSGIGDILFGVILAFFCISLKQIPLFIILNICSCIIMISWSILFGSLPLYFGKFEKAAKVANESLLTIAFYPMGTYTSFVKFILMFVIPASFISGIPVQLLTNFNLNWFLGIIIFAIFIFVLSIIVFYKGLKRYESGNSMQMRG